MYMGDNTIKPIVPSFVVQEKGARKVLVYLDIPELKVKRTFPNILKFVPSNEQNHVLDFQNRSFTFTISFHNKSYSISIARLIGEIQPDRCSIEYQRGGCWITLYKLEPMPWMNKICDDFSPGLDTYENDNETPYASAPVEEVQLKDTDMPPPFNSVPLAPPVPPPRLSSKKVPAPPPPPSSFH